MTIKNRFKFIFGIIFVFMLVFVLSLYLNNALSTLHTSRADLNTDSIAVGTDYPGLVVNQYIQEGDKVHKGEKLFEIRSQQLNDALSSGQTTLSSLPFSLNKNNQNIILEASSDGFIQKINYGVGSYAPLGSIVATLNTVNSLFVEAHYSLSPQDYARIQKGDILIVTFPDNSQVQATVYNISLVSNGTSVDTVLKARLQHADLANFRFSVGTPVQATLKLTTRTWYQGLSEFVRNLFKPSAR